MLNYLWGGGHFTKTENEDFILAMREDLDHHGEFTCKVDGTMEFVNFLSFRSTITRQIWRKHFAQFNAMRQKLDYYAAEGMLKAYQKE